MKNYLKFLTILFAVITLSALLTHLLELHGKLNLSIDNYKAVQSIYSGWAWLGMLEILALALTLLWAISAYHNKKIFSFLVIALVCFITGLVIFFVFTFPANNATANWTILPPNWKGLRKQWEYSHAVHAVLYLVGFCFIVIAILNEKHISKPV